MRALILTLVFAGAAGAQQPPTPPTPSTAPAVPGVPAVPDVSPWVKYSVQWAGIGESIGSQIQHVFDDTAFKNVLNRDPQAMDDPAVKAALQRYLRAATTHSGDVASAKRDFHRALVDAHRRHHASGESSTVVVTDDQPSAESQSGAPGSPMTDAQRTLIDRVRHDPAALPLPGTTTFSTGARAIGGGTEVSGTVATVGGPLAVAGTIDGDAIAVGGDVLISSGAHVKGNAFAAHGTVRVAPGGRVDGEMRSLPDAVGPVAVASTPKTPGHRSAWRSLELAIAWSALALVLGIGVLTFAGDRLEATSLALSEQFGRSLAIGFASMLAILPALVVVIVLLCVTIVGIIVVPVAIVGYVLLVIGMAVLGFAAVAETTGHALYRHRANLLTDRGAKLRGLVTGIGIFMGLWILAAALGRLPAAGAILRGIAASATATAIMAGFGAVIVARQDARRSRQLAPATGPAGDNIGWQTPTPVAGVTAARRPTPAPPGPSVQ